MRVIAIALLAFVGVASAQEITLSGGPLAGVTVVPMKPDDARAAGLPADAPGVLVTSVDPFSDAAGTVHPGDIIQSVNRNPVRTPDDLRRVSSTLTASQFPMEIRRKTGR